MSITIFPIGDFQEKFCAELYLDGMAWVLFCQQLELILTGKKIVYCMNGFFYVQSSLPKGFFEKGDNETKVYAN